MSNLCLVHSVDRSRENMKVSKLFFLVILSYAWVTQAELDEKDGIYETSIPEYEPLPETNVLLIDDIEVDPTRNAVSDLDKLWPSGVVPYTIHTGYPSVVQDNILAAMREIEQDVNSPGKKDCIHFKHRIDEHDYIRVLPRGSRCSSAVGRKADGYQEVSIGRGCESQGTIMHELIHSLGFHHEHTRPDRDQYLDINFQNLGAKSNFYQHPGARTLNTKYDYSSIMHYGPYTFAVDASKPVFTSKQPVPEGVQIGQRLQLSENDVRKIQRLYKCKEDTSHVVQRVTSSGQRCDFSRGLCHFTQDTTDDFDWVIQSGPSASGPKAGLTTGTDKYAIAKAAGHLLESARLVSNTWFTAKRLCVDFSYFFSGTFVGNGALNVGIKPKNESINLKHHYRLLYGEWRWSHKRSTIIFTRSIPYQLVFEARIFKTDIALDNINIYEGDCV